MEFYLDFSTFESKKKISDCLLFKVNIPQWKDILGKINPEHIWKIENSDHPAIPGGYQIYPHVTLLFGIHTIPTWKIAEFLKDYPVKTFKIEISGIDIFRQNGKPYDVLKMSVVRTPELEDINNKLKQAFNHSGNQHSEYKPHITIAYIKGGYSQLYTDPNYRETFYSDTIIHSVQQATVQNPIVLTDIETYLRKAA